MKLLVQPKTDQNYLASLGVQVMHLHKSSC